MSALAVIGAGLVGFVVGVAVMSGYGYAVAFLTLVQEEKRATQRQSPPSLKGET